MVICIPICKAHMLKVSKTLQVSPQMYFFTIKCIPMLYTVSMAVYKGYANLHFHATFKDLSSPCRKRVAGFQCLSMRVPYTSGL